jgi:sarcosine oxidase
MGASVSYNLAKRGLRVLNIERYGVNNQLGSSHGKTRIIRLAYYEDPRYVPLLRRAYESWREVETKSGKKLLRVTGGLMIGRKDGELVSGVLRSAREHRLPHEVLSASEAERRFEALTLEDGMEAVYEAGAGVLSAEDCVRAFVGLASEAGCDFRFSENVHRWSSVSDGVEVETSAGRQTASRLVLCAGAWNSKLAGGGLPLKCERQVPLWFSSAGQGIFAPPKMPLFIIEEDEGVFYYAIPDLGHGVKVARTHGGETGDPDAVRREVTQADIGPVQKFISRRLKRLDHNPIASTTCLYSNTPDLNFAIGQHPAEPRIVVLSACSGHGFKFASVLGEVTADMATDAKPRYDLSFISLDRFTKPLG